MEDYLILLARFSPVFVRQELIPEIERNCEVFGIYDQTAYETFRDNKYAQNSLYFHHSYAVTDILIGQGYDALAYSRNGKIQTDSIQKCPSRILCFFTAYRTQPSVQAMRGHHELSLIQFVDGLPPMLNELFEITERKPIDTTERKEIYLGSENGLRRLARREEAVLSVAELLEGYGITDEKDFETSDREKVSVVEETAKQMIAQKYQLEESDGEEVLDRALFKLGLRNRRK